MEGASGGEFTAKVHVLYKPFKILVYMMTATIFALLLFPLF